MEKRGTLKRKGERERERERKRQLCASIFQVSAFEFRNFAGIESCEFSRETLFARCADVKTRRHKVMRNPPTWLENVVLVSFVNRGLGHRERDRADEKSYDPLYPHARSFGENSGE